MDEKTYRLPVLLLATAPLLLAVHWWSAIDGQATERLGASSATR
jgi:hypothetical protein